VVSHKPAAPVKSKDLATTTEQINTVANDLTTITADVATIAETVVQSVETVVTAVEDAVVTVVDTVESAIQPKVDTSVDANVQVDASIKADAPSDALADAPSDSPGDAPADSPIDSLIDAPIDSPSDAPVDVPSDAPIDSPVDSPSDAPIDDPSDSLTDDASDAPSDCQNNAPIDSQPVVLSAAELAIQLATQLGADPTSPLGMLAAQLVSQLKPSTQVVDDIVDNEIVAEAVIDMDDALIQADSTPSSTVPASTLTFSDTPSTVDEPVTGSSGYVGIQTVTKDLFSSGIHSMWYSPTSPEGREQTVKVAYVQVDQVTSTVTYVDVPSQHPISVSVFPPSVMWTWVSRTSQVALVHPDVTSSIYIRVEYV
jgi:hypothetical protein